MLPTTVFWPSDVDDGEGYCYGWTRPSICVAGTIRVSTSAEAEKALEHVSSSPRYSALVPACGGPPIVLGEFSITAKGAKPTFQFALRKPCNVIYYSRHSPNSLRFYVMGSTIPDTTQGAARFDPDLFTLPRSDSPVGMSDTVLHQFNAAQTLDFLIQEHLHPTSHLIRTDFLWTAFDASWTHISPVLCATSNVWHIIGNCPIFDLKNISATLQQIDVRAEQADFFATEVKPLRQRGLTSTPAFSVRYTNFFNVIWLLLNDITIGSAIGTFLCENNVVLARRLNHTVESILVQWMQWVLLWLDSWPAGLKLNTELSRFYSCTFIDLISLWGSALFWCSPYMSNLIYAVGIASSAGATITISLSSDLLAILTIHIYVCYIISNFVYARFLGTAGSLWNLFRGKRYNVLRNRTDTWEYELDQLLFGTILFTLVAFLFPTVLAYYSLFAVMRLAIILLQACLEMQLAFMNHFPLFALMLRAKDPWRIPGGIYFSIETRKDENEHVLSVKSQPVPFSAIFFQYIRLVSRLASHYNPLRLLWYLISGRLVHPIPRYSIRYNKSPNNQ